MCIVIPDDVNDKCFLVEYTNQHPGYTEQKLPTEVFSLRRLS